MNSIVKEQFTTQRTEISTPTGSELRLQIESPTVDGASLPGALSKQFNLRTLTA